MNISEIAHLTPGFSGADLANLVNEAAINAVRADRTVIRAQDLQAARDRVLLGHRDTTNALLPEERHAVAVHESGHALLAALCPHADPVAKVTILPAGMALGATEQLPEVERHLYSESYLTDLLTVRVGGRAAELVVLGEGSTGAADDLTGATDIATRMVREFGLSRALGPVGYGTDSPNYLQSTPQGNAFNRPYSEQTQRIVDEEVARLLRAAEERAIGLLRRHRLALDHLAALLVEKETVDGSVVLDVLRTESEVPHGDGSRDEDTVDRQDLAGHGAEDDLQRRHRDDRGGEAHLERDAPQQQPIGEEPDPGQRRVLGSSGHGGARSGRPRCRGSGRRARTDSGTAARPAGSSVA